MNLSSKYKFVNFKNRSHNFKSFCQNLQKKCSGDSHQSSIFKDGKRQYLVTVWGDSPICMIQYYVQY